MACCGSLVRKSAPSLVKSVIDGLLAKISKVLAVNDKIVQSCAYVMILISLGGVY